MRPPWIRRLALAFGLLLALLVAALAVLVATFDANRHKALAIDWMKAEHQRTLAIDGPIELGLWPRLALEVSGLRLSEQGRSEEFLAVDEAALALRWLPLLRGELVIDRIGATGVRAALHRDAQGRRNIDDLLARSGAPAGESAAGAGPGPASGPVWRFDVSAVQLTGLQLRVQDRLAGIAGELTLHSLRTGRLADGVETPVSLQAGLSLAQPRPLQLKLKLKAELALTPDLARKALAVKGLALELQGDAGAARPLSLTLAWPQVALSDGQLSGSALQGRYQLGGPLTLAGEFRSAAPSGNVETLRWPGLALTLAGSAGARRIDGTVRTDLVLHAARGAATLERIDLRATLSDPGLQPLQLVLQGRAGADAQAARWALDGRMNDSPFDSNGQAQLAGARPEIQAQARFDSLDLNRLLAPEKPAPTAPAAGDTPVRMDALDAVDGRFTLAVDTLAWRQYRVTGMKAEATLTQGRLDLQRLAGRSWGGNIVASGHAIAASQALAIKLEAEGVDVQALLKDVAGKDLLEGRGRVQADVTTSGANIGAMRSQLAGRVAIQVRDGAVKGLNLARAMRQARAALSGQQDALSQAKATEKTDFTELSASARIASGVAHSDDLDLKSPYLRIGGAGRFDIGQGRIDYTARATVTASPAGQDGAELRALRGVTVPVVLSGPFDAIDWRIQWSGVAAAALENKLKDKIFEKLGGRPSAAPPEDKLKEKLRGLFK